MPEPHLGTDGNSQTLIFSDAIFYYVMIFPVVYAQSMGYVVVPVTDGTLLLELPGGETATATLKAGVPYARMAGVEHNVVNAGSAPLSFVETELKHLIG